LLFVGNTPGHHPPGCIAPVGRFPDGGQPTALGGWGGGARQRVRLHVWDDGAGPRPLRRQPGESVPER
jgi:hypothetical protein